MQTLFQTNAGCGLALKTQPRHNLFRIQMGVVWNKFKKNELLDIDNIMANLCHQALKCTQF